MLDDILSWDPGRTRRQLYLELLEDKLLFGWKATFLFWSCELTERLFGRRKMLIQCLGGLHSGHNSFLEPIMERLDVAAKGLVELEEGGKATKLAHPIIRSEVQLTTYRRRLYVLALMTAPSGLGEALVGTIVGEFDRQLQFQMLSRAPNVQKARESIP
jgi:hypothetical protein